MIWPDKSDGWEAALETPELELISQGLAALSAYVRQLFTQSVGRDVGTEQLHEGSYSELP